MYSRDTVVDKASIIGIEISPTPPLIFTGGQKVRNLASLSTLLNFEPPAFENTARYPNSETNFLCRNDRPFLCRNDRPMSLPSLVKLGPCTPETRWAEMHGENMLNRQYSPWIIRFRSKFVQSLNTWQSKYRKSSRSRGQRSRSQLDITWAKNREITSNLAANCSISLKFRTNFDHVTLDVLRTYKVNGSKVKITAWHNVSA